MSYQALQMKRRFVADKVIVGVDPAKAKHQAAAIDAQSVQMGDSFSFKHSYEGFSITLWQKLNELGALADPKTLVFAIESLCNLWQSLSAYLQQRGFTVLLVSPFCGIPSGSSDWRGAQSTPSGTTSEMWAHICTVP